MSDLLSVYELSGTTSVDAIVGQGYFPVISSIGGQDVLIVHRGGAGHIGLGGRLDAIHSTDGGETWGKPRTIADSERDDRNPALGVASDGSVVLAYHWQGNYDEKGDWVPAMKNTDTRVVFSNDGGKSWADDDLINFTPINGASPFGKIHNVDGILHMLIYSGSIMGETDETIKVGPATTPTYILRSTDHGRTWGDPTLVALGLNESDMAVLPDGQWLFVARSEEKEEQAIHTCTSDDQGHTWKYLGRVTDPSEHPPDLTLLSNGWLLLIFGRRHPPYGVQGMISRDGGKTWDAKRLVLDDTLPGGDIGYPSTVRLENGRLVTAYYTAGSEDKQWEIYKATQAACKVVCYDEEALIESWCANG
jgi:sialidase-1